MFDNLVLRPGPALVYKCGSVAPTQEESDAVEFLYLPNRATPDFDKPSWRRNSSACRDGHKACDTVPLRAALLSDGWSSRLNPAPGSDFQNCCGPAKMKAGRTGIKAGLMRRTGPKVVVDQIRTVRSRMCRSS